MSVDFLRITLRGGALAAFKRRHRLIRSEFLRGAPKGFCRAERFANGWVRRWGPWHPDRAGCTDYESWEYPGGVPSSQLAMVREVQSEHGDTMTPTVVHLAYDVIGEGYPDPLELRGRYEDLKPRGKNGRFIEEDGGQTWYVGTPGAEVWAKWYHKGRELRAVYGVGDAPDDWVRFEFMLSGWAAHMAFEHVVIRGEPMFFGHLVSWFFRGDVSGLLPKAEEPIEMGPPPKTQAPSVMRTVAMLKQYGPMLQALQGLGVLNDLVSMVEPSRMARYRADKMVAEIHEQGVGEFVGNVATVLFS